MPISIRDVAARAGVSVGTVSKVLNGGAAGQIAVATQERVRHAAEILGYAPNTMAQALVRGRSGIIGVLLMDGMVSPLGIAYFASLFDAILVAASERSLNVLVVTGARWRNREMSLPAFQNTPCDGFLVFHQPDSTDMFGAFLEAEVPFVVVSQTPTDPRVCVVDVDNLVAGRMAAEHLLSLGHRQTAILTVGQYSLFEQERIEGFLSEMASQGIAPDSVLVMNPEGTDWFGIVAVLERLVQTEIDRPTALFCLNDYLASMAIRFFHSRGINVPEDIAVIGFDGLPAAAEGPIPLTTLAQPFLLIAGTALDLLHRQLDRQKAEPERIKVSASLVVRESTVRPV